MIDFVLPDELSFVPKGKDYFAIKGFRERGFPDLDARGWEEFLWKDQPFGFHVRSQPKVKDKESLKAHYRDVESTLESFLAGAA